MFVPEFRTRDDGLPLLSNEELEALTASLLEHYQFSVLSSRAPFQPGPFMESYLGIRPEYQYLTSDGSILGMTIFAATDKVIYFDKANNRAEYMHADAGRILIDTSLTEDPKLRGRLRFTIAHEIGHRILHTRYFLLARENAARKSAPSFIACRDSAVGAPAHKQSFITDHDWLEWQANRFASCLLMPESIVREVYEENRSYDSPDYPAKRTLLFLRDCMAVSHTAALNRLADLKLIRHENRDRFEPRSAYMQEPFRP